MKQEELDKVCEIADEMLNALQKYGNIGMTRFSNSCIKDVKDLFRKQVAEKCGISD